MSRPPAATPSGLTWGKALVLLLGILAHGWLTRPAPRPAPPTTPPPVVAPGPAQPDPGPSAPAPSEPDPEPEPRPEPPPSDPAPVVSRPPPDETPPAPRRLTADDVRRGIREWFRTGGRSPRVEIRIPR